MRGMFLDDDKPKAKSTAETAAPGVALDGFSVAELEARVVALKAEIARCEAEIAKKQAHNAAASALFKL